MVRKWFIIPIIILVIGANFSPGLSEENEVEPTGIISKPSDSSTLEVNISTDKDRYLPEGEVRINYDLSQDAYVYLFNIDTDGEVNLLFPNKYDQDNRLKAGEGQLPGKGYSFLAGKEQGKEYFQMIASKVELPVFPSPPSPDSDAEPFPILADDPGKFAETAFEELDETIASDSWVEDWSSVEVTRRTSRLEIISKPSDAKIYVDDNFVDRTPATIDVRPGRRQVKLLLGTDLRWTEVVYVESNQIKRLEPELERINYATISIRSEPPEAKIYIDDEYKGETPMRVSTEAKEITIKLRKDGYPDWQRELRLYPNESRELSADLQAKVSPGSATLDLDLSFGLGLNLGGFLDGSFSPGLELTINDVITGLSISGRGDPDLPEKINWENEDFKGEKLDYGPAWGLYFGYPLKIYEDVFLRAGAGLAIQPQAQLEQLESSSGALSAEPMTEVARDAQLVFDIKPTFQGGIQLKRRDFLFQLTYQSSRGPVIGLGYEF